MQIVWQDQKIPWFIGHVNNCISVGKWQRCMQKAEALLLLNNR